MTEYKIPLHNPTVTNAAVNVAVDVLKARQLSEGYQVRRFETAFRQYTGGMQARMTSSCTAAIHLALLMAGVRSGDMVMTPAYTYVGGVAPILYCGAVPVWVDSQKQSPNIGVEQIDRAYRGHCDHQTRPKVLIVTHIAGNPADLVGISRWCQQNHVTLLQDCAHAVEADVRGVKLAAWGDYACYSFHTTKTITCGDGGMLVFGGIADYQKANRLMHHGRTGGWDYNVPMLGHKYHSNDLAAAIAHENLKTADERRCRRGEIAGWYMERLGGCTVPETPAGSTHAWHLFQVFLDGVDDSRLVVETMRKRGIEAAWHYRPVNLMQYYHRACDSLSTPWAWYLAKREISLPIWAGMTEQQVDTICTNLLEVVTDVS